MVDMEKLMKVNVIQNANMVKQIIVAVEIRLIQFMKFKKHNHNNNVRSKKETRIHTVTQLRNVIKMTIYASQANLSILDL